jgi:chromosome segregation ATPase
MKAQETLLAKKHEKVDVLSTKLAALTGAIDLHKDLEEGEAIRRQITVLKEETKEAQRESTTLNRVWLKFQHELLETASKQSKAEAEIELLTDKASLLEEKSARLALKTEAERRDLFTARKLIRDLRNAVTQLTHEMSTQEEAKELFEREMVLKRAEYKAREKDLSGQISQTNVLMQETLEAIAELKKAVSEAERFAAAWDRKYQLCKEFRDVASEEDHGNGESC